MQPIGETLTQFLLDNLKSDAGPNRALEALRQAGAPAPQNIRSFGRQQIATELAERSDRIHYPSVLVFCDRLSNSLFEKFRDFSGTARMTMELRTSDNRLEEMSSIYTYAELLCTVLSSLRGNWMEGVTYNGGYEVTFSPIKSGGQHFVQIGKISFEVNVSR